MLIVLGVLIALGLLEARRVLHFRPAKLVRQRLAAEDGSIGPTVETG